MVHLVLERPRESVLPLLIQHCIGSNRESSKNPGRTDVSKKPFWSIAFPIYYVLLSFTCNVLFLVGSCLFLPIKSSQASVSFTFVVENIDVDKVMTSNKGDLFEQLENNFTGALASDQSNRIKPHHTHFQWRKTTSCSLDEAMLFDVNIYPRDGNNITALQSSLPSVQTISHALNRSFAANGIDKVATGQVQVNIVNRPRIMETSVVQKWAVDFGCTLFIIGSALLAAISGLDLLEDMLTCGLKLPSPKTLTQGYEFLGSEPSSTLPPDAPVVVSARAERLLYLTGGLIFLIGTFYFQHPQMVSSRVPSEVMQDEDVLYAAIWMFIIGSIIFVFATFLNALSLNSSGRTFAHWAVATCGIYELGGILFVMGSVCFMPNQGCKEGMEILGAWCFIVGAACYMLGDFIEFMKTCALIFLRLKQEEAARQIERAMLCYLFRRRLESVGRLTRSRPVPSSKSAPSRGRRESLKEVGLVRAFTEALGQQPIIQALQLRDIPKLECAGAFDRRKELSAPTSSWPMARPMV
ncbi:unnamed protein product [Cladocopium goreaui]|uniref:YrhK domain-containing protein n=1 Tax=Cladocopium goreaui TaxID=2562237 RepID=A0A9P1FYU9_9DINO|nr:unnamed protein product [Cladocopium goreaui]